MAENAGGLAGGTLALGLPEFNKRREKLAIKVAAIFDQIFQRDFIKFRFSEKGYTSLLLHGRSEHSSSIHHLPWHPTNFSEV